MTRRSVIGARRRANVTACSLGQVLVRSAASDTVSGFKHEPLSKQLSFEYILPPPERLYVVAVVVARECDDLFVAFMKKGASHALLDARLISSRTFMHHGRDRQQPATLSAYHYDPFTLTALFSSVNRLSRYLSCLPLLG